MGKRKKPPDLNEIVQAVALTPHLEVERVDDWRVYLKDPETGRRTRRICGCEFPVSGMNGKESKTCRLPAGKGTVHLGIGRCRTHELPQHELQRLYKALALDVVEKNQKNPLKPFVEKATALMQQIDIESVNHELAALYTILLAKQHALRKELESTCPTTKVRALRELQRDIQSIAKLKIEIRKEANASEGVRRADLERLFVGIRCAIEENLPLGQREIVITAVAERTSNWANG